MAEWGWESVALSAQLPHVQDVGASKDPNDWLTAYWVGSDGSLWRTPHDKVEQVRSPGDLTRVAVGRGVKTVWCVDRRGRAWVMRGDYNWSPVPTPGVIVVDVDVAADNSAWLVMKDTRYQVQPDPMSAPREVNSFLSFTAITGIEQPVFGYVAGGLVSPSGIYQTNEGKAWGVSDMVGDDGLVFSDGFWRPGQATILGVVDLSTSPSNLWMVKTDGSVWTTTDGRTQLRRGDLIASRIAANGADMAWAVAPDGRAWVWAIKESVVVQPPPPPKPAPAKPKAEAQPPVLKVNSTGEGNKTVFKLTGSGFLPSAQVTVRGVRVGDGQVSEYYWLTS